MFTWPKDGKNTNVKQLLGGHVQAGIASLSIFLLTSLPVSSVQLFTHFISQPILLFVL